MLVLLRVGGMDGNRINVRIGLMRRMIILIILCGPG